MDAARAAKDRLAAVDAAREGAKLAYVRSSGTLENVRNSRAWHAAAKPDTYSYPTLQELADWESKAAELQTAVTEAQQAYTAAWDEYQAQRVAAMQSRDAFQNAADVEAGARTKLSPSRHGGITLEVIDGSAAPAILRSA